MQLGWEENKVKIYIQNFDEETSLERNKDYMKKIKADHIKVGCKHGKHTELPQD